MHTKKTSLFKGENGINYLFPFILVTTLFALWGFANDITNPMVAAFKNIMLLSHFESSLVQFFFYGGYCIMAIPAAVFISRFDYKKGILIGLTLYTIGCFLFIPASNAMAYWAFLAAYFVMTCGLAFLETTANPYVLSMGPEATATRRLNFAQAFNPMGSLTGMFVAKEFILYRLNSATEEERKALGEVDPAAFKAIQQADLDVVSGPYIMLGFVVLAFLFLFFISRLPKTVTDTNNSSSIKEVWKRLRVNKLYKNSVAAQMFYVGAQITIWTYIIQYAGKELDIPKDVAQGYNMIAMAIFFTSRFICTFLLKYFRPSILLRNLAIGAALFTAGAIFLHGMAGLYSLIAISACMSLMFPTIYGIALKGLGEDSKLASAGLIFAIVGGGVITSIQGLIMDISTIRVSYFVPLLCFVIIAIYGAWVKKQDSI